MVVSELRKLHLKCSWIVGNKYKDGDAVESTTGAGTLQQVDERLGHPTDRWTTVQD